MFSKERCVFTTLYLCSFGVTLFSVFKLRNWVCTLLAIALQFVAMVLYALSYLPAGMGPTIRRKLLGC